ncbi:MAG: hypothetical protein J6N18_00005 [Kiritimatiellae bacterium]|nr:hypothetical protein [Kiritimatiellia bacterium]
MRRKTLNLSRICRRAQLGILTVACVLPFVQAAADSYRFFVSGYPAENNCSSKESAAVALASGTLSTATVASSFDARFRSLCESQGVSLRSDKFCFFGIVIR